MPEEGEFTVMKSLKFKENNNNSNARIYTVYMNFTVIPVYAHLVKRWYEILHSGHGCNPFITLIQYSSKQL